MNRIRFVKMSAHNIVSSEMINKYASLGYFHYKYVESLSPDNGCKNILKDLGRIATSTAHPVGNFISISVANFSQYRRHSFVLYCDEDKDINNITINEIVYLLCECYPIIGRYKEDCFVKFDYYTVG